MNEPETVVGRIEAFRAALTARAVYNGVLEARSLGIPVDLSDSEGAELRRLKDAEARAIDQLGRILEPHGGAVLYEGKLYRVDCDGDGAATVTIFHWPREAAEIDRELAARPENHGIGGGG